MGNKIIQRIDGVLKHIDVIQKNITNISYEEFVNKSLLADAISFNLSQIGERMNKIEKILKDKYPDLPWKETRRMRNIIVHDYDRANFKTIYNTAVVDLPILKQELQKLKDDINSIKERTIETKRLILRPWNDFDAIELFDLAKEPEIGYWCGWEPHKHIRDSMFALHNFLEVNESYAICLKENGEIVGSISLTKRENSSSKDPEYELGFWIGKQYWNNGYATEASKKLIVHAFDELMAKKLWCGYYDGNKQSMRVQEKLGFKHYCVDENAFVVQLGIIRKSYISVLTKEQWSTMVK